MIWIQEFESFYVYHMLSKNLSAKLNLKKHMIICIFSYRSSLKMMPKVVYFLVLSLSILVKSQHQNAQNARPPVHIPPTTLPSSQCSKFNYSSQREAIFQGIDTYMSSSSRQGPPSACGSGDWTRAVFLNMSNTSQSCPSAWNLVTTPVRSCGRRASSFGVCDSESYPISRNYSSVCGRIITCQIGLAGGFHNAFRYSLSGIDDAYLDGVSLTHGPQGLRVHIWSFVGAWYEQSTSYRTDVTCPCTNTQITWSQQIPSFINNNYFCDTGNPGPTASNTAFYNDPLWDGQGCGSTSSCCTFNTPPYFSRTLNESTSDALEIRNCYGDWSIREDKLITLIDIYAK